VSEKSVSFTRIDDEHPARDVDSRGNVVVVGNFDGVHRGHRAVIHDAARRARASAYGVCLLTFDPHPAVALGRTAPAPLMTLERRAELIADAGIPRVYVRTFDAAFASTPPEAFVSELLVGQLGARVVEVGENFRFGKGAAGDRALLADLSTKYGFAATTQPLTGDEKGPFSSSRARAAVAAGDMEEAAAVLGRPHAITGLVARGDRIGRALGWPTANLSSVPEMLPPDGVYAAWVDLEGERLGMGALSIGVRPTVAEGLARAVEVFVLDANKDLDLYGRTVSVAIVAKLRGQERFDGLEALKAQIARDVEAVRRRLARGAPTG
jgi:riboflavin kinase/FMN adenylyltransferase